MNATLRIHISGVVQGVGFRPWVARLAGSCGVTGSVCNIGHGVEVLVSGEDQPLRDFQKGLCGGPPGADIHTITVTELSVEEGSAPTGGFEILPSTADGAGLPAMPRDRRPCPSCLDELRDRGNRRYRYPFISCTECGPRFTILESMPFDRERTSMAAFDLCDPCSAEYADPMDRRYHAQTNACAECGPQLWLTSADTKMVGNEVALQQAQVILSQGGVLAVKGVGGYQLVAMASCNAAVERLRDWKQRQRKPLAVMLPDLSSIEAVCRVSATERDALTSAAAPIVLLSLRQPQQVSPLLAPGLSNLGVMLPASPLHQLLADDAGAMLVVTSANRRAEPLIIDDDAVLQMLGGVADAVLGHNRAIARMADDSVVRFADEHAIVLRHARGMAPTSIAVDSDQLPGIAYGGHMKAAPAIFKGGSITLMQHIGDLGGIACQQRLLQAAHDFVSHPRWLATDAHPDYASTMLAGEATQAGQLTQHTVFHHLAHVAAVAAEHQLPAPLLGVAFDGTGLGVDGHIWGGEFITIDSWQGDKTHAAQPCWRRVGTVMDFPLPGGDAAVREPRRAALGLAWRLCDGDLQQIPSCIRQMFTPREWQTLTSMLKQNFNCPQTSSVGRLFDALAACLGLIRVAEYDGEAAMLLEAAAQHAPAGCCPDGAMYNLDIRNGVWDWRSVLRELFEQIEVGCEVSVVAARWHDVLSSLILQMVQRSGLPRVVLSGGVFQNARLLQQSRALLQQAGVQVYCHQQLPANDGSLAVGQAFVVANSGLQLVEDTAACV